ncbi:hypothetical protein BDP81DRAFT_164046 [Colletotrichum phormii]|uniref:Secreted protein n=1 Tax=Colletotrichum phormii TaxID=359342 RepID=A0AAJ0EIL0_9PEZI|nr:uncharacterized protein BDP81DRAFT_164046 [Colletotrichum phormii]KAK1640478.1 hypothetical protein BDP81DRAFT_164046 [Colletotrichum phormii]
MTILTILLRSFCLMVDYVCAVVLRTSAFMEPMMIHDHYVPWLALHTLPSESSGCWRFKCYLDHTLSYQSYDEDIGKSDFKHHYLMATSIIPSGPQCVAATPNTTCMGQKLNAPHERSQC